MFQSFEGFSAWTNKGLEGDPSTARRHASISSNRISYSLGLRGASASVDTACSSSLVALHIACKDPASFECYGVGVALERLFFVSLDDVGCSGVSLRLPPNLCTGGRKRLC